MQLEDHETSMATSLQEAQRQLFAARQKGEEKTQRWAEQHRHLAEEKQVAEQH